MSVEIYSSSIWSGQFSIAHLTIVNGARVDDYMCQHLCVVNFKQVFHIVMTAVKKLMSETF